MDGERPIQYIGRSAGWRATSTAYTVGDLIFDNTFVCQCITAGITTDSGWGPVAGAAFDENGQFTDGTVVWQRITETPSNGVWRSSSQKYPSGTIYLCSIGEESGYARIYRSLGGTSGSSAPADTTGTVFSNGTLSLAFAGISGGINNAAWIANTSYNEGDLVVANGSLYRCVFDGKLTMPSKTVFENITTNMNNGHVFWFYRNTDIPTKQGNRPWEIIIQYCEGIDPLTAEGITGDTPYFCHSGNPNPSIIVPGSAPTATTLEGYGITDAYTKSEADASFAPIATTLEGYGI
ncbi:MAG: hypothetical protein ACRDBM_09600, partial [Sporomusa sp.]